MAQRAEKVLQKRPGEAEERDWKRLPLRLTFKLLPAPWSSWQAFRHGI